MFNFEENSIVFNEKEILKKCNLEHKIMEKFIFEYQKNHNHDKLIMENYGEFFEFQSKIKQKTCLNLNVTKEEIRNNYKLINLDEKNKERVNSHAFIIQKKLDAIERSWIIKENNQIKNKISRISKTYRKIR